MSRLRVLSLCMKSCSVTIPRTLSKRHKAKVKWWNRRRPYQRRSPVTIVYKHNFSRIHSDFFRTGTFLGGQILASSQQLFFQNSYLFGAKLLPTSFLLRVDSSLGQLVFQNSYYLGRQISSEDWYLQKSFFFEADTSTKHQIF